VRSARAAGVAALVLAAACAHRAPVEQRPGGSTLAPDQTRVQEGFASYYGHRFHGRRTASGARYDMNALTCAHPSASFGTRLRVTELAGGRSVVVTVTDRGPFARGRVIDLSLAAARALRIVSRGVARVRVERLE
jgi:rare lipoprotein A